MLYRNKLNGNKTTSRAVPLAGTVALGLIAGLIAAPAAHAAPDSSVILKLRGPVTSAQSAALAKIGAYVTRRFDFIGSVSVTVPSRNLAKVAALPFVTHLSSDGQVKKCDEFANGSTGADYAYSNYALSGSGINVAVLDTGINVKRDDVQQPTIDAASFVPGDSSTDDTCGHGTHVGGIIAGNGTSSTGPTFFRTFYGVARRAGLVNVRVLDANGQGNVSSTLAGIQWVIAHKNSDHIRVMNLSLGHPVSESYKTDPLCLAVEEAWKSGIVVVCAAGNTGRANTSQAAGAANEGWGTSYGSIQSPANDPCVITVGATKRNFNADGTPDLNRAHDKIASYSSRGPSRLDLVLKPDILAPGNKVISVAASNCKLFHNNRGTNQIPQSYYTSSVSGVDISTRYFRLSGTSMAAPVVAGAAALLLQKYPNLTPDTIKARLMISADKWSDPSGKADPCTYGAGYLNIPAALACTAVATAPALSPVLYQDGSQNVYLDGNSLLSASHLIWGTNGLNDLHIIWGSSLLGGSNVLSASHVIWGNNVFADHIIWGSTTSAVDLTSIAINGE